MVFSVDVEERSTPPQSRVWSEERQPDESVQRPLQLLLLHAPLLLPPHRCRSLLHSCCPRRRLRRRLLRALPSRPTMPPLGGSSSSRSSNNNTRGFTRSSGVADPLPRRLSLLRTPASHPTHPRPVPLLLCWAGDHSWLCGPSRCFSRTTPPAASRCGGGPQQQQRLGRQKGTGGDRGLLLALAHRVWPAAASVLLLRFYVSG